MWDLPDTFIQAISKLTHPSTPVAPPASAPPKPPAEPAPPPMKPDTVAIKHRPVAPPRPTGPAHAIPLEGMNTPWVKDPSFANDGAPIGSTRYMAFGNLRNFFLKGFDAKGDGLSFHKGQIPIHVAGLNAKDDGLWAPQVKVVGNQVVLLYCAGEMHDGINWPSFRMHMATMPLAEFERQAKSGKGVTFKDQGVMFKDQQTFGGNDRDFAMIDPHFASTPDGKAWMTYTVVKAGIPGVRAHQEFVRVRQVDPNDPSKALGPDKPLVDGWTGGPHDGVAEAQDVVTIHGKPFLFVSSRAGDKDQRVYVTPFDPNGGPVPFEKLKPVMEPGADPWRSNAVGSTSAAVIDGKPYMVFQGMNNDHRFTLGYTALTTDPK